MSDLGKFQVHRMRDGWIRYEGFAATEQLRGPSHPARHHGPHLDKLSAERKCRVLLNALPNGRVSEFFTPGGKTGRYDRPRDSQFLGFLRQLVISRLNLYSH